MQVRGYNKSSIDQLDNNIDQTVSYSSADDIGALIKAQLLALNICRTHIPVSSLWVALIKLM